MKKASSASWDSSSSNNIAGTLVGTKQALTFKLGH